MAVQALTDQIRKEKAAERYPPLFKRLPDRLFAPLASANRLQYWSLLCALHAKRFGPEAPLPPSRGFLMREITADIAEELQYQDWAPDGDDVTPATPLAIRANMVFNRLREAEWIRVERVGVREMVTMAPAVAHFMNRLVEFAHTGPEFVSGKIRSVEANLKLLLEESTDGSSLQEAARQSRALLEQVRIAGTNVRDLMLEIGRVDATGEFVRRFFDDYVERMFIGDYKELRIREHPLARRQEILRLAAHVQQTPAVRVRLIQWYLEKQAGRDPMRAEAMFERDIQKVEDLRRIDEYLDRLDDEIRRANKLALAYLDYRLRAARPLDELIGQAIEAVVTHGSEAAALSPFAPGECIAGERLVSPRVENKRAPPSSLRKQVMSPEQEARARLALMARDRRTMSLPKLAAFVRQQLGEGDSMPSLALQVDSIESVRALQVLCTVAAANATSSKLLRANARAMSSGFTTVRMEGEEDQSKGISHLPFVIVNPTKTVKGGSK
ncbi:Wadjet anti-phage system protein JetA family protein [Variovorax rhizosphaerae]|uniref:Wadjet anti-phage system protein JetA family protein n=1 Tax=Variovorax rhizosphaerae TaxID=1836200 RepID=A0ABU8WYP4_9BURK